MLLTFHIFCVETLPILDANGSADHKSKHMPKLASILPCVEGLGAMNYVLLRLQVGSGGKAGERNGSRAEMGSTAGHGMGQSEAFKLQGQQPVWLF